MLGLSGIREKLIEATSGFAAASTSAEEGGRGAPSPNFRRKGSLVASPRYFNRRVPVDTSQNRDFSKNGSHELRRRFLFRLAIALHTYGSSASRTEHLIERAAERLHVDTNIAVFPTLILLSFNDIDDDLSSEIHLITVESELDVGKLARADELAISVGKRDTPLVLSYWRLKAIATAPQEFGTWWRLFSYALSASMASLLFFNGNLCDALFSFVLGLLVGVLDIVASRWPLFASVMEFIVAVLVSFLARVFSIYLKKLKICVSSLALSALVELLPGMPLTLGVSEMVAKSHVTGTSRVIHGLFSALQLGFGLAIGDSFLWWSKAHDKAHCTPPSISKWWNTLWLVGYIVASNILLNARLSQWPGMGLAATVGYVVAYATDKLGTSASTVLAAFSVGITGNSCLKFQVPDDSSFSTGTLYSHLTGELPLALVLSGILLLVPGGLGVEGIAAMFGRDVASGMAFVFDMLVVALSITIGLLIAKIVQPGFGASKFMAHNKSTLAAHLEDDASDVEREEQENMAI
ncbi:uncharacterized UPF0442 protein C7D4.12c isoform X1 [Selaginella moellendorffii]|uniref:uncharacterized UPF0442 protein C7D4.12c isoform X1 n=1 Tax=Selaginella moellendorffii TaxID=88036 RepID=UPI000D1D04EA|nr:uncharacterized UPF0442 protein C7D4.12c isoform X1 [Selaginella moellendorffii]|eukprot:XP_024530260.1 uncharacterized UPF0442 protein C7D4.12c isoform X1 [Selaginella moellendorffii]